MKKIKKIKQKDAALDFVKANSQIIFATYGMMTEGIDIPRLDAGSTPRQGQGDAAHRSHTTTCSRKEKGHMGDAPGCALPDLPTAFRRSPQDYAAPVRR